MFAGLNTKRGAVSFIDTFNARLVYAEPVATAVAGILGEFGLRVPRHHGGGYTKHPYAYSLGSFERLYNRGSEDLLRDTLRVLTGAWSEEEPDRLASPLVLGVGGFIYYYGGHPDYRITTLIDRLSRRGSRQLIRRIADLSSVIVGGSAGGSFGNPASRLAILDSYNRGARRRLPDITASDMKRINLGQNPWRPSAPDPGQA